MLVAAKPSAVAPKTTTAKTATIQSVQAARGLAALLVVICHSGAFLGQIPGLWQHLPIYLWSRGTALGVQMFFVISGLVIFRAHRRDLNRPGHARAFYWKRFRRVYSLYWICLTLTLFKHHAGVYPSLGHLRPVILVSNYLLFHFFSYQTIMVQAWTLFDEVQFYLVFGLCILNRKLGLVTLSLWLTASLLFFSPATPYWRMVFSPYHLLFGCGILVALALETEKSIPAKPLFWMGLVVFAAALVIAGPFDNGVPVRLAAGVGAACLLLGGALLERQRRLTVPRWLSLLGDASYSIYLVHFMVISAIARFAYAHWGNFHILLIGWMFVFILSGVAVGIVVHYTVERPLLTAMGRKLAAGAGQA